MFTPPQLTCKPDDISLEQNACMAIYCCQQLASPCKVHNIFAQLQQNVVFLKNVHECPQYKISGNLSCGNCNDTCRRVGSLTYPAVIGTTDIIQETGPLSSNILIYNIS
jgi:hypothetical protein